MPGKPIYLGLDAGTQSLKALAVDEDLNLLPAFAVQYDVDLPQFATSGGVHRRPDGLTVTAPPEMWAAALDLLFERMQSAGFPFASVAAISGSGQQHGSVYLRRNAAQKMRDLDAAKPLPPQIEGLFSISASPVWMDCSTTNECRALEKALGGPRALAELTGSRAYERFTGNQIAGIFRQQPDRYAQTERIALVSSFMAGLLTGTVAPIDLADASGMNLLDIRRRQWSPDALAACAPGLAEKLGEPVVSHADIGPVGGYFAQRYGFAKDCRVMAFSGDNPNSLAGLRLQNDGDIAISLGTSDTVFGSLREPRPSPAEGHVFVNPIDPEGYMVMLCFKNGSLTREKVCEQHANGDWALFGRLLGQTPPGNHGRIGLFFHEPEITPPLLRTGVFRCDGNDTAVAGFDACGDVRAVVESQFLSMRLHGERLGIKPRRLLATGGASANSVILRVMADVFGVTVAVMEQKDSAALGAAYRAMHGLRCRAAGRFIPFDAALPRLPAPRLAAEPDIAAHNLYSGMLERYARLEKRVVAGATLTAG